MKKNRKKLENKNEKIQKWKKSEKQIIYNKKEEEKTIFE